MNIAPLGGQWGAIDGADGTAVRHLYGDEGYYQVIIKKGCRGRPII